MSDLVKRMKATLGMNVISPGSSADEYRVAAWQFAEAMDRIAELEAKLREIQGLTVYEHDYDGDGSYIDADQLRAILNNSAGA